MSQQFNSQVFTFAKQFADNAFKAQSVALGSLEKVVSLQIRALESQSQSAAQFIGDAFETRDADGLRALWEKGAAVSRENTERAVALTQEIAAISQKTAETLGALVQEQQQAANDAVAAPVAAAKKAAGVVK